MSSAFLPMYIQPAILGITAGAAAESAVGELLCGSGSGGIDQALTYGALLGATVIQTAGTVGATVFRVYRDALSTDLLMEFTNTTTALDTAAVAGLNFPLPYFAGLWVTANGAVGDEVYSFTPLLQMTNKPIGSP